MWARHVDTTRPIGVDIHLQDSPRRRHALTRLASVRYVDTYTTKTHIVTLLT